MKFTDSRLFGNASKLQSIWEKIEWNENEREKQRSESIRKRPLGKLNGEMKSAFGQKTGPDER